MKEEGLSRGQSTRVRSPHFFSSIACAFSHRSRRGSGLKNPPCEDKKGKRRMGSGATKAYVAGQQFPPAHGKQPLKKSYYLSRERGKKNTRNNTLSNP